MREALLTLCQRLEQLGLNKGTSGNVSCRERDHFLITPSGMPVSEMRPESIVAMDFSGKLIGDGRPSSEWHFHLDLLKNRPELNAIVHTHSPHATALACLREDLPEREEHTRTTHSTRRRTNRRSSRRRPHSPDRGCS